MGIRVDLSHRNMSKAMSQTENCNRVTELIKLQLVSAALSIVVEILQRQARTTHFVR
jgi:hypothetical protein